MARRRRRSPQHGMWTIDGLHPAEYAAQWGCGNSGDGALYYNAADVDRRTGETIANPHWSAQDWERFAGVVDAQCAGVASVVDEPHGRRASGWTGRDVQCLAKLADWARYMAGRCRSSLPWLSSTM